MATTDTTDTTDSSARLATLVIDPVTRIEGHLRMQVLTNSQNVVTGASATGTMARGLEVIVNGRDPRDAWAFTQRACGVCTLVHAIASVRAVENAIHWTVPPNAQLIRNLMIATQMVTDHVLHFYQLHALDWVDITSALNADPAQTAALQQSLSSWPNNSTEYFAAVKQKLSDFVATGHLGIFANGYWGHPGYLLPPHVNLLAFAHYLEALTMQREAIKLHAILGGKNPHPMFLCGGVPSAIASSDTPLPPEVIAEMMGEHLPHHPSSDFGNTGTTALNATGHMVIQTAIERMRTFVDQVYVPDSLAIMSFYKGPAGGNWDQRGEGIGNFITLGEYPDASGLMENQVIKPRVIFARNLKTMKPFNPGSVTEFVVNSWYDYSGGKTKGLNPFSGETKLHYTGPTPPYAVLNTMQPYSYLKSPRYNGVPMEAGPLSRILVLYATGHAQTKSLVDSALAQLGLPFSALYSTLGRTVARTLDAKVSADLLPGFHAQLKANIAAGDVNTFNEALWDPATWPSSPMQGLGWAEAPRGGLSHWIKINGSTKKLSHYQIVAPSTWNGGPRDTKGVKGPWEEALIGHMLAVPTQPLELLRTIHSFDPCLACAVHVMDPGGKELVQFTVKAY
jgi:hydrogenase large subunit